MMKLADHAGLVLTEMARRDARIFVLDGDLADSDGALHFARSHPSRFLMAGIAEQNMISVAAGMSETGLCPYVFSFAAFLCFRSYDQIRVCLSQAPHPVTLIGSHAGGLSGRNGKTHAALNDLALMLTLPNMNVWAPADSHDVELALTASQRTGKATYIRLPRRQFPASIELSAAPGHCRWLRPARKVTLLSTGLATHWALDVQQRLEAAALDVGLLHCASLKPLPDFSEALRGVEQVYVLEDHYRLGGLASSLRELELDASITSFGWPEDYCGKSGTDEECLNHCGLSSDQIAATIARRSGTPRRRLGVLEPTL